jgi:hypothetical protein
MRTRDPISIPLPFEDWPAADRQAWDAAITPASLFGSGGTAAHWAAVTLRGYRAAYGRWLRFLISQGTGSMYKRPSPCGHDQTASPPMSRASTTVFCR